MSQVCEERKRFFFEKKNQKTSESWAEPIRKGRGQICKSFLLLFFKKEGLAACPAR
jgi:hypothetical protein